MGSFVRVALTSEVLKKPGQLRCVQSPSKPIPTSCATADHRLGARHAFWTAAADTGSVPSGRPRLYRSSQRARQSASFFSTEQRGSHRWKPGRSFFSTEQETKIKYDLLKIQLHVGPMSRLTLPRNKSFEYLHQKKKN